MSEYLPSTSQYAADHVALYLETNGAEGANFNGIDCVVLTTIGQRTGAIRRSPVVRVKDGDAYIVIGSRGGAPEHPQWYFNVLANPAVTIHDRDQVYELRARLATGTERETRWQVAVATYAPYAEYQARTTRQIPVFVCESR